MAAVALAPYIVFGVWHWAAPPDAVARTGSTGYRGISRRRGATRVLGGIAFIAAMMGGLAAPLPQLLGVVSPLHIRDYRWADAAGLVLAVCGLAATMDAQLDMGDSWRVGVDTSETTKLVRTGTFKVVATRFSPRCRVHTRRGILATVSRCDRGVRDLPRGH